MFSLKVIDTDEFIDMPSSARLLYYDLSMRADDDGFVASPKKIQRMTGCSNDDFKLLIAKQYLIPFETGVCVIKHWRLHNYISKDRYTKTIYSEEFEKINEVDGVYECEESVYTKCIQNVDNPSTQVRLGKDRLGKDRLGKDSIVEDDTEKQKSTKVKQDKELTKKIYNECVEISDIEYQKLIERYETEEKLNKGIETLNNYLMTSGKKYKSHYHVLIGWVLERVNENEKSKGYGLPNDNRKNTSNETDEPKPRFKQIDYIALAKSSGIDYLSMSNLSG